MADLIRYWDSALGKRRNSDITVNLILEDYFMEGFIKTTSKFSSMLCWVLPHEKNKIENIIKSKNDNYNIIFIDSLSELKNHIDNNSFVYLSTTRATNYSNKTEIIELFNNYPQTQFCMGDYEADYNPMKEYIFYDPLAGNFVNVYPRMIMLHTAIEAFSSGEFPDPWADVSPYLK